MKRMLLLLLTALLIGAAGCQAPAAPTEAAATPTPTLAPTPAPTDDPAGAGDALDISAALDISVPTGVRNVAIKLAQVKDEDALVSYVFGSDVKNTNATEDTWDDNGVVTVKEKMWEMKDPDDARWLYMLSTGNVDFNRETDAPADGLTVTVERARELLTGLLNTLGLPSELGEGAPALMPDGSTPEEMGLYPEFEFRLKDVEGLPISGNCALSARVSTDGESIMSLSTCLMESARPVGEPLTLIAPQQAADAITATLAGNPYITNVPIDKVRLAYDLRRVKGMTDTGLLVPVWEFEGPEGDWFVVDAVTGVILGNFSEEVVAEPSQVQ